MFLIKAEDTTLSVSGLNCADTSKYFRRLAQRYRQNNSGQLTIGGAYDIASESRSLKERPGDFESMRDHYAYRREYF